MTQVQELIYSYTAGLIDGEGTITLSYKYKSSRYRWPIISVPSCTPELVDFLQTTFGGSISNKRPTKADHSQSQAWHIAGDKAIELLQKVLPYLREPEKKRRASMIVENYKRLTPRNGKYTDEQKAAKLVFEHQFFEDGKQSRQSERIRWAAA